MLLPALFNVLILGSSVGAILAIPLGICDRRDRKKYTIFLTLPTDIKAGSSPCLGPARPCLVPSWSCAIVFIIAIGAFFPILLNTLDGVKSIKKDLIQAAYTLGAKECQVSEVILPGAAAQPYLTVCGSGSVSRGCAWLQPR